VALRYNRRAGSEKWSIVWLGGIHGVIVSPRAETSQQHACARVRVRCHAHQAELRSGRCASRSAPTSRASSRESSGESISAGRGREQPVEQIVDDGVVREANLDPAQHLREQLIAGGDEDSEEVTQRSLGEMNIVHDEEPGGAHARRLVEVVPEVHDADRGRELVVGLAVVIPGDLGPVKGHSRDTEAVGLALDLCGQLLGAGEVRHGLGGALAVLLAHEQSGDGLARASGQLDRSVAAHVAEAVKHLALPVPELREGRGRKTLVGCEVAVRACHRGHHLRLAPR